MKRKRDGVNESVNVNDIQPQTQHNRLFFVWRKGGIVNGEGGVVMVGWKFTGFSCSLYFIFIYIYIFFLYLYGWMENGDNRSIILYMSFMIGWWWETQNFCGKERKQLTQQPTLMHYNTQFFLFFIFHLLLLLLLQLFKRFLLPFFL